jgi:HAMP domain-containing protein
MTTLLAAAPALPLHTAGKYVAGAYVVFLAIVLIYVGIMAKRLASTQRELVKLKREVEAQEREHETASEMETAA